MVFDCLCTFESWPDKRDDLSRWGGGTIQWYLTVSVLLKAGLIRGMISLDGGTVVFDCLCTFESWPDKKDDLSRWGDNSVVFDCLCTFERGMMMGGPDKIRG